MDKTDASDGHGDGQWSAYGRPAAARQIGRRRPSDWRNVINCAASREMTGKPGSGCVTWVVIPKHSRFLSKVWRIPKRTLAVLLSATMHRGADTDAAPLRRGTVISTMSLNFVAGSLGLSVAACTSIGPGTVSHDRIDYATAIGNSWQEQTLLNIIKLRYADMPIFLAVDQVVAGYQLQSTVGASFTAGNFNAARVGPFTASGSATAAGTYTDRPTVIYSPLTGVDFLKRLMTPVPPSSMLFALQSGYSAARIMPIMLESINGLNNGSNRLRRLTDPKFTRLVELMQEGQLAGAIQIRIEVSKSNAESSVLVFGPSKDPEMAAKGREVKSLLGIRPDLRELKVNYGGYSGRDDEIDMMTRSMLQIMLEFAAVVQVPQSDVEQGKALPGLIDTRVPAAPGGPPLQVLVTDVPPKDAFVAVQYHDRWFWIADADIQSKYTFGIIMLLFSIADTGVKGVAPVVTIPANQ